MGAFDNNYQVLTSDMFLSKSYSTMYRRSFMTNFTTREKNMLENIAHSEEGINKISIVPLANEVIMPKAEVTDEAFIPNGFETRRLSFMMAIVEIPGPNTVGAFDNGVRNIHLISGYTDEFRVFTNPDGSLALDPNTMLFINNYATIREILNVGANTTTDSVMLSNNQLFCNYETLNGNELFRRKDTQVHTIVPAKLFRHNMLKGAFAVDDLAEHTKIKDTRAMLKSGNICSSRRNNIKNEYLYRAIDAYTTSVNKTANNDVVDLHSLYRKSCSFVNDGLVTDNSFLKTISRNIDFNVTKYVTYGDLCTMMPDLDFKNTIHANDKATQFNSASTEYWNTATTEGIVASVVLHGITSLLHDCFAVSAGFTATNYTMTGEHEVKLGQFMMYFDKLNARPYIDRFISLLKTDVLSDISRNGQVLYKLKVECFIYGSISIEVSIDGGPITPFYAPVFCDSVYSPMLADSKADFEHVAQNLEDMLTTIVAPDVIVDKYPLVPISNFGNVIDADPYENKVNKPSIKDI